MDTYIDVAKDGTVGTSRVGAGDPDGPAVFIGSRRIPMPVESNCLRICSLFGGNVAVVAGQDDRAYRVWVRDQWQGFQDLGPCFGRQAVAITRGIRDEELIAIVRRNGIYELFINGVAQGERPAPAGGLGILDLLPTGEPEFCADPALDAPRQMSRHGLLIDHWVQRGDTYAGLLLGLGDQLTVFENDGPHTVFNGKAFEPHLTLLDDGRKVISFREENGSGHVVYRQPEGWPPFRFQIEALGKKAVGAIYGSSERYGYGHFGGNCETLFGNENTDAPPDNWVLGQGIPAIAGIGAINVPWPMRLGTWHDTRNSTFPLSGPHPHFVYDEATGERHVGVGDVLLVQAYPKYGESVGLFELRVSRGLDLHKDRQKLVVLKFYPGNAPEMFTEDQLIPYFSAYERLVRRPDVQGLLAFEGMRSGLKNFPLWLSAFEAFAVASSGLPEFHTIDPPQEEKPTVMNTRVSHLVTAFPDDDFDNPIQTRSAYTNGPWEDVDVVKNSDGTYSIRNTKGTEWLSVQRDGTFQSRPTSDPAQPGPWERFNRAGNTLVERNKDQFGGFIPPTRPPVTFLVAGSL